MAKSPSEASLTGMLGALAAAEPSEGYPLFVQAHGARVAKEDERLVITVDGEAPVAVRLAEVSHLAVLGSATVTTPALHELMRRDIPVTWQSESGWLLGISRGLGIHGARARLAQVRATEDAARCLALAWPLVAAKIRNGRGRLRDRHGWHPRAAAAVWQLGRLAGRAETATSLDALRGIEGGAAAVYFAAFGRMLAPPHAADRGAFQFTLRTRQPPGDAVNAMLSYAYALLTRTMTLAVASAGLDPAFGFLHALADGRPSLALDLIEPYRPLIADSVVAGLIGRGVVRADQFAAADEGGIRMVDAARRALIAAFETRLEEEITPDWLGHAVSYRRLIFLQPRLLVRHLLGDADAHPLPVPRR